MTEERTNRESLLDRLPAKPTPEQFEQRVGGLLSEKDREQLGEGASKKIADALVYVSLFAPDPATFDISAVEAVTTLPEEDARQVLDFATRTGLIRQEGDRFILGEQAKRVLNNLLEE